MFNGIVFVDSHCIDYAGHKKIEKTETVLRNKI